MVDRRTVLQAAGTVTLGLTVLPGCSSEEGADSPPPATPDQQQADELALITAYDLAIAVAGPSVATQYQRIRDEHTAHLRALGWSDAPAAQTPGTADLKRRDLIVAERRAGRLRTRGARGADDPDRAQILALIAASEAQHVVTLEGL